ncbi:zinc finger, GRF-type [Artemisia annua]|uniref:Zinc finger, GRF-type n=1 Tax=Artemisia annua TaxID=35608 RepID=A0A2U1QAV6_ARTAN|nr:zinc finger, GRF-type [Artemisia annua]
MMVLRDCGNEGAIRTSLPNANLGRRFYTCPQIGGSSCQFFLWFDPLMFPRSVMIISGLLRARNRVEQSAMELVQEIRRLKMY